MNINGKFRLECMLLFKILIWQDKDTNEPDQVMKIPLPGTLKRQLVDDWEFVTKLDQVYGLYLAFLNAKQSLC